MVAGTGPDVHVDVAERRDSAAPEPAEHRGAVRTQVRRLLSHLSWPVAVFAGIEVAALIVWLNVSRNVWFDLDEWDFLVERKAGDVGDLLRSHNGHWTTLPILAYRFLYWAVGLRTYLPYRLMAIVLYLFVAALLRIVLRRAGVNPWIATAAAGFYAFFGTGWGNIFRGFQITLTGALAAGLAHLLLADHEGPVDRRDAAGIVVGFIGLMTSGLAAVMIAIVGVVMLLKRGWRVALLHTVPFVVVYVPWALTAGHRERGLAGFDFVVIRDVVWYGYSFVFKATEPAGYLALPLVLLMVGGLVLAVVQRRRLGTLGQLAAPMAMFAAAAIFLAMSAAWNGREIPDGRAWVAQTRYLSIAAALVLPALAVAVDAFVRRWRWLLPVALVIFVAAIPRNVDAADQGTTREQLRYATMHRMVVTLPRTPAAREAPRSLKPERLRAWRITMGWLLDAAAQHRLPASKIAPIDIVAADFRLSFDLVPRPRPTTNCVTLTEPYAFTPQKGDVIGVYNNAVSIQRSGFIPPVYFPAQVGTAVVVLRNPGPVRIAGFYGGFFANVDSLRGSSRVCIEHAAANPQP